MTVADLDPSAEAGRHAPGSPAGGGWARPLRAHWLVLLGAAVAAIPTLVSVARFSWSTEQGAHGPIVLVTGIWLVMQRWAPLRATARRGQTAIALAVMIPCLLLYILARITDILEVEGFALYGALVAVFYAYCGRQALRLMWFPLVYFLFLFPPPDTVVAAITQPLKLGISAAAVDLLRIFDYPIARAGVMIQVGQYQILVAAACAGLNSLISLSAIGLFYVYIRHNANWRYALLLMLAIVPVAIFANFIRVLLLILITYHMGDAAAQGFLHGFSGLTMFVVAVLGIFGVDALAAPLRRRLARGGQG
ncbi:MAG TPA: exosortase V [Sphingomonadaceae bacterium]|nr:exosortase V [Sphingomonadaceae bacterium]